MTEETAGSGRTVTSAIADMSGVKHLFYDERGGRAVTQGHYSIFGRETNSRSSESGSWSAGMNVRPETTGSKHITPPPYSCTYHAYWGLSAEATNSTCAKFP